jgi:hypothetical protein
VFYGRENTFLRDSIIMEEKTTSRKRKAGNITNNNAYHSNTNGVMTLPGNVKIRNGKYMPSSLKKLVEPEDRTLVTNILNLAVFQIIGVVKDIDACILLEEPNEYGKPTKYVLHLLWDTDDTVITYQNCSLIKKLSVQKIGKIEFGYDENVKIFEDDSKKGYPFTSEKEEYEEEEEEEDKKKKIKKLFLTVWIATKWYIFPYNRSTVIVIENDDSIFIPGDGANNGKYNTGETFKRQRRVKRLKTKK